MINELTKEQINKFPEYVDYWFKIGLSTEPLDFEKAKKAAISCYKQADLAEPKYFYKFQSPFSAAIGACFLKDRDQVGTQVRDQVRDQVGTIRLCSGS